jgi:hypothetical protein
VTPLPVRAGAIATAAFFAFDLEAKGEHFAAETVCRNLDAAAGWPQGACISQIRGLLGTEGAPFEEPCSTPFCQGRATDDSTVCPECADNLEQVEAMIACPPARRGH